jgi:hypothetical protein
MRDFKYLYQQSPCATSPGESEYLTACSMCMTASHINMLLYDHKHHGTTRCYSKVNQSDVGYRSNYIDDRQPSSSCPNENNDKVTKLTRHVVAHHFPILYTKAPRSKDRTRSSGSPRITSWAILTKKCNQQQHLVTIWTTVITCLNCPITCPN